MGMHKIFMLGAVVVFALMAVDQFILEQAPAEPMGQFTLTSEDNTPISDADFKGDIVLLYFGFTHCPEICPTDLNTMSVALNELDSDEVSAVFITIDPERDTVARINEYLSNFHPALRGATGTQEEIDAVKKQYGVYAKKVVMDDPMMAEMMGGEGYMMDHTAYIYLLGRNGEYIKVYGHGTEADVLVSAVRAQL